MRKLVAIFGAAAVLTLPAIAMATDGRPELQRKNGKVVAESVVAKSATVKAIDKDKRLLTLQMPDGREQTLVVDKSVKKLGKVDVGDVVKVQYREAISIKINKTKVPEAVSVEGTVSPEEKSVKPAATAGVRVTTTATIQKIYDDGKKAVLKLPDGKTADVEVRDPENREKIKKGEVKEGDQIMITYYQAVAIAVEKAAKK